MTKMLTKHGNSYALVIDKPIMELLGIDPEKPVEVSSDGSRLIVAPVSRESAQQRFRRSVARTGKKNAELFRRLAK